PPVCTDARLERGDARVLVDGYASLERDSTQAAREQGRLHRGRDRLEDAAQVRRRPGPLGRLVAAELHERARTACALDRREGAGPRTQLRRPGRRPEPALAPIVRLDPGLQAERADLVHGATPPAL